VSINKIIMRLVKCACKRLIKLIALYDMVYWYLRYNSHEHTVRVNFMIKCVCVGFGSNGFVTKTQIFPMDSHYRTKVISKVGHPKSDSVVSLVLCTVVVQWLTLALYYRFFRIVSTLLKMGNISGRLYY
jgi:hypothetical protein